MDHMHGGQLEGLNWGVGIEEMTWSSATVLLYSVDTVHQEAF